MLNDQQIRLYARQVILRELGHAGQAQLCASRVAITDRAPEVARVASDYLQRAGLQVVDSAEAGLPVPLPDTAQILATAREPALRGCAEWLLGAWAAVETIKRVAGVGSEAKKLPSPWTAEVD